MFYIPVASWVTWGVVVVVVEGVAMTVAVLCVCKQVHTEATNWLACLITLPQAGAATALTAAWAVVVLARVVEVVSVVLRFSRPLSRSRFGY